MTTVHITMNDEMFQHPEEQSKLVDELTRNFGLREINDQRLRLGIITGKVDDPKNLAEIKRLKGVESVSTDSEMFAI